MSDTVSFPNFYLKELLSFAGELGMNVKPWQHLAVTESQGNQTTLDFNVFRDLILEIRERTIASNLGVHFGQRLSINMHGSLSYAAINCRSAREFFALLERFLSLRLDLFEIEIREHASQLIIEFHETRPLLDTKHAILEVLMLSVKNMLDFITRGNAKVQAIQFEVPQDPGAALAVSLFRCQIDYSQPISGLIYDAKEADKKLTVSNPTTYREALKICQLEQDKLGYQQTLAGQIRKLLYNSYADFPTAERTAAKFYMSSRTLHRRLAETGDSYTSIVNEVRQTLAKKYLLENRMSVQETAYALGYFDSANFRRAFKRWYGVSPSKFSHV